MKTVDLIRQVDNITIARLQAPDYSTNTKALSLVHALLLAGVKER